MREKANTLSEVSVDKPYYTSREHLIDEMANRIRDWNACLLDVEKPHRLFISSMKSDFTKHRILIHASMHPEIPIQLNVERIVDNLLYFVHDGELHRLKREGYVAHIELMQFERVGQIMKDISVSMNFDYRDIDHLTSTVMKQHRGIYWIEDDGKPTANESKLTTGVACKICDGSGKIELLTSYVDCDCVLTNAGNE